MLSGEPGVGGAHSLDHPNQIMSTGRMEIVVILSPCWAIILVYILSWFDTFSSRDMVLSMVISVGSGTSRGDPPVATPIAQIVPLHLMLRLAEIQKVAEAMESTRSLLEACRASGGKGVVASL